MSSNVKHISWALQILHLLLFAGSVFCAICLRGNPLLMYGVLLGSPITLLLSRLPFSWFPGWLRQLLQIALSALAVTWAHRQLTQTPVDILLIEIAAILGVALFLGRNLREHSLLYIISIGFLGYGGLAPGRPFFLIVFPLCLLLAGCILYLERNQLLASFTPKYPPQSLPRASSSWTVRFFHAFLVICLVIFMLKNLPQSRMLRTKGLIPVSFSTEQDITFSHLWQNWNTPASKILGGNTQNTNQEEQPGEAPENTPIQNSPDVEKILNMPNEPTFDSREGGSGTTFGMGQELVFRAHSPAKLYWVVQMYDDYDGDTWRCTPALKYAATAPDRFKPIHEVEVPQHISLEKITSNKLPYAFRYKQATFRNDPLAINQHTYVMAVTNEPLTLTARAPHPPPAPWHYRVQSFVPNPEGKRPLRAWREPAHNAGWNYRRLPDECISQRLHDLAADITRDATSPYDKAVKIRDYLRSNYTYSLTPPPVPKDRETVDFFLFDSKSGYCQHFAQAFTVLARLAGLHSRLVTGYAPGNYNLLTNDFEVYEYHAHAWTHIFVEPYGWLTFDGVAPANLNLRNTPAILTNLMDPFGDEWDSHPPELTYIPPPPPSQSLNDIQQSEKNNFLGKVYQKAAQDNGTEEPNITELGKAAAQLAKQGITERVAGVWQRFTQSVLGVWGHLFKGVQTILRALLTITWLEAVALVFSVASLSFFWIKRQRLFAVIRFLHCLYRCRKTWEHVQSGQLSNTAAVTACHTIATRLLNLARIPRQPDHDLMELADDLQPLSNELAASFRIIAQEASHVIFAEAVPEPEQTQATISATRHFCMALSPFLSDAMVLMP